MVIAPSDLRAIRIECSQCRATTLVQLDQPFKLPNNCPVCRTEFRKLLSGVEVEVAHSMIEAIKTWRRIESDRRPAFTLRFELAPTGHTTRPATPH